MQRFSLILSCLVFLFSCLFLASGCANNPALQVTSTQGTGTQGTTTPGTTTCTGTCTPWISLVPFAIGLRPGVSFTFSATANNVGDPSVTWSIKEGPTGGIITDGGLYTAPAVEGVYHVIATSKASTSLSQTATVAVTATELTVAGKLSTARWYHTASLLPSGQVFIAGGMNDDYDFADPAELYDPAAGKFHDAGPVSRIEHSATVLANGDVLLAGGFAISNTGVYGPSNTADLRKAGSGVIQPTGSMNSSRSNHSATLLQDGRVLLAGGATDSSNKPTQTAELYDPATGKFTSAGNMATPRSGHSSALLRNGRVLIVGGGAAGAEFYDPATNTFLPAPGVSANRCYAVATLLADGSVLIAGGVDCSNTLLDTAEIYDPSTGQFTPTGKLVAAQAFGTATLLPDGRVLIVGGNPSVLSQIYDPTTGSFTFGPHLASSWSGKTATLLPDGSVLILGGGDDAEIYW
jgi:hypothetical protein